ncbi:MAG: hypothetical protein WDZ39_01025 [Candidatus Spechtbacterales bacterium]
MAKTTKQNTAKRPILAILVAVFLFLSLSYVVASVAIVQNDYRLSDLESSVSSLEREHNELRIELSRVSSLDYVLEQSDELAYTEVQSVNYIQKPVSSPIAAR